MEEILIPQTSGHVGLRIYSPQRDPAGALEYFTVEVSDPTVRATVRVYAHGVHGLAELFASMAHEWKGWTGAKEWSSVEEEFGLSCTSDGMGHVRLDIALRPSLYPEHWRLQASAKTEAGQLDGLTASARRFVNGERGTA